MCGLLDLLKSPMLRPTQKQRGSVPKRHEVVSDASTSDNSAAQTTSKVPQYMFEAILNFLDQENQKETSNPKRRASIQLCRDFVSEFGFPEEDHYIFAKDGAVRVLTEEERSDLPSSPKNVNNFLLVSSISPLDFSAGFITDNSMLQATPEWDIH